MIFLFFAGLFALMAYIIFIDGPRLDQLKLDEENERLLDREMLRSIYAKQHNDERMLENQLIKKTFMKVQSLDWDDDDFQAKPIAEMILKVIGK